MPRRLISGKKFKAITYTAPRRAEIKEYAFEFKKGLKYPSVTASKKILLPAEKRVLENFVVIKVEGCGICGTDIHMYHGKRFLGEGANAGNPVIPGHEIFGKVVMASGKAGRLMGQEVIVDPIMDCYGENLCDFCRLGKNYMHTPFREMGVCGGVPGGFGEYTVALAKNCFAADNLSYRQKALAEPLATLCYAFNDVMPLDSSRRVYLIFGSGTAGLLALQYLKVLNRKNLIIIVDLNKFRLSRAKKLGADIVLCSKGIKKEAIISALYQINKGEGFKYILELSGSDEVLDFIPSLACRLSNVLLYGLGHKAVTLRDFDLIIEKEIRFYPSLGASNTNNFKKALGLISKFDVEPMITHVYSGLDNIHKVLEKDYFAKRYIKGVLLL